MKETSGIKSVAVFPTMNFKTMLYMLVSIAVLFIAIIPARIISGVFSQDASIFCISFAGFVVLLEFLAWCFLCAPMEIYESLSAKKVISDELSVAEKQAETEQTDAKIVSEKSEMPLAIKEETKNDIVSSWLTFTGRGVMTFIGIKQLIGKSSSTRLWNIFIISWLRSSNRMTWRLSAVKSCRLPSIQLTNRNHLSDLKDMATAR